MTDGVPGCLVRINAMEEVGYDTFIAGRFRSERIKGRRLFSAGQSTD